MYVQVANRISEMMAFQDDERTHFSKEARSFPHLTKLCNGERNKYSVVNFNNFILNNNEKNKWFLTNSNEIVQMDYATKIENKVCFCGNKNTRLYPFFHNPFNSTFIKVFMPDGTLLETKNVYATDEIYCKMIALNYKNNKVFIPLLHTSDIKM